MVLGGECHQLLIKKPVSKLSIFSWQVKRAAQEHTNKDKATRGRDEDSGLKRSPFSSPSLPLLLPLLSRATHSWLPLNGMFTCRLLIIT